MPIRSGGAAQGAGKQVILAAAGRYWPLRNEPLAALDDGRACEMIAACLEQRASQRGESELALHFAGRHGRSFAVYIESTAPIRKLAV